MLEVGAMQLLIVLFLTRLHHTPSLIFGHPLHRGPLYCDLLYKFHRIVQVSTCSLRFLARDGF